MEGGLTKFLPDGGTPQSPRKKPWKDNDSITECAGGR